MSTSKTFTVGQVLTSAQCNDWPQGILGVSRVTSPVGPTSGTTELDLVTAPAVTISQTGRRLRIRFHARAFSATVTGDIFIVRIKEGATILAEASYVPPGTSPTAIGEDFEAIVDSPTAASHTYKATIQRSAGTGTATADASANAPITITVEDAGAV